MNIHNLHFTRRATYYIILSLATIAVIFFITINPAWRQMDRLEQKIRETESSIEEQDVLYPLYTTLMRTMDTSVAHSSNEDALGDYPDRVNVDTAVKLLNISGIESGLDNASFSPVPASLSMENNRILFNAALRGDFNAIVGFLSTLANMPFFLEYQSFEVRSRPEQIHTNMKIWIAVE